MRNGFAKYLLDKKSMAFENIDFFKISNRKLIYIFTNNELRDLRRRIVAKQKKTRVSVYQNELFYLDADCKKKHRRLFNFTQCAFAPTEWILSRFVCREPFEILHTLHLYMFVFVVFVWVCIVHVLSYGITLFIRLKFHIILYLLLGFCDAKCIMRFICFDWFLFDFFFLGIFSPDYSCIRFEINRTIGWYDTMICKQFLAWRKKICRTMLAASETLNENIKTLTDIFMDTLYWRSYFDSSLWVVRTSYI